MLIVLFENNQYIPKIISSFYIYIPCKQKVRCDVAYCSRNSRRDASLKTRRHKIGNLIWLKIIYETFLQARKRSYIK